MIAEMLTRKSRHEHGFTLIELLVVILIIGVLAAIAVPVFLNQRTEAQNAALKSDLKNMAVAMETWQVSSGKKFSDIPPVEGITSGWTVVVRHAPTTPFMGTVHGRSFHPEGFDPPALSEGVAIGAVTSASMQGQGGGGYCLAGNAEGSDYEALTGMTKYGQTLYYDSINGGLFEPQDIPKDGACKYHYGILNGGTP